jgi:hypothetical protein
MSYKHEKNQLNKSLVKLLMIFLATVLVTGCGTKKIDLSEQNKANIPEFFINKKVVLVNAPSYLGNGQVYGGVFGGAIGALAGSLATESEPAKITRYLDSQKIDIKTIVRSEFERQLLKTPRFSQKLKEAAKAQIQIEIYIYGLAVKSLSTEYKPWLGIKAKFINESGLVVWEQSEWVGNANGDTPSYTYDEYFQSPEAFNTAYASAAKEVVKLLIEEMD